jgi:hypothetical protein
LKTVSPKFDNGHSSQRARFSNWKKKHAEWLFTKKVKNTDRTAVVWGQDRGEEDQRMALEVSSETSRRFVR